MLSESTQVSMICCPPSSAKAAEKMLEPTKSQHTMAVVFAVRKTDSFTTWKVSLPVGRGEHHARRVAPMAAASVGVAQPKMMLPSTERMSAESGKNEPSRNLKIWNRSTVKRA